MQELKPYKVAGLLWAVQPSVRCSSTPGARLIVILFLIIILQQCVVTQWLLLVLTERNKELVSVWSTHQHSYLETIVFHCLIIQHLHRKNEQQWKSLFIKNISSYCAEKTKAFQKWPFKWRQTWFNMQWLPLVSTQYNST